MRQTAYVLRDVRYVYAGSPGGFALELDALGIESGDILALVGPNGAGKTTLLMILAYLIRPAHGKLEFFGEAAWADERRALLARRESVLVTHHPYLFKGTIFDNIAFGLRVRGIPEPEWPGRARRALDLVELGGRGPKTTVGLSAGEAQRVALARAIALEPKALLLDEPTANIEAGLALRIEAVIREISRETGTTVVFSSHNFSQASRLADDVLYLSGGRRVPYSHENCFSGTVESDGRRGWIEPRPGARIVFPGPASGHVTCVIDPADIELFGADNPPVIPGGPNVFGGRVTRLETTEADSALVRVSGDLTFRVTLPLREVESRGISLSRRVLIKFKPEDVEIIGSEPSGIRYD